MKNERNNVMDALVDRVIQRSKNMLKEKKRKRNVAALVDFVSNLLVTAGNVKGVGMAYRTQQYPKYEKAYREAQERLGGYMRDFKGRAARTTLWHPIASDGARNRVSSSVSGGIQLLSGKFDEAVKGYEKSKVSNKRF